ncbi:MAG: JAB domain-containing protein [Myxococcales bacterium]|nr:JAB domain-containing protein [Myxococcales bacterium]
MSDRDALPDDVHIIREVHLNYSQDRPVQALLTNSDAAAVFLRGVVNDTTREHAVAIYLDAKNRPLGWRTVSIGTDVSAPVKPLLVLQPAVLLGANAMIFSHNHPSGDLEPRTGNWPRRFARPASSLASGCSTTSSGPSLGARATGRTCGRARRLTHRSSIAIGAAQSRIIGVRAADLAQPLELMAELAISLRSLPNADCELVNPTLRIAQYLSPAPVGDSPDASLLRHKVGFI